MNSHSIDKLLKELVVKKRHLVKMYLETGGDPNVSDSRGRTLLHYYAAKGDVEMITLLLKYGADVNARDARGRTPLHYAVAAGRNTEVLLLHGADPNAQDDLGNTPLHYAVRRRDEHAVRLLLMYFADPRIRNKKCMSPIDVARKKGLHWYELVKLMEEVVRRRRYAALTSCVPGKRTPLHEAIEVRDLNAVYESLLPLGSVDVCDEVGRTPLHYAAMLCGDKSVEIVKMILEPWRGTNVNVKDVYGRTPLHYAAIVGELAVVQMLLEHYADPTVKDINGKTPLDYARERGNSHIIPLLEQWTRIWQLAANRRPTDPDAACYRARCNDIFRSARFGYLLCVKNLLDADADPNARDRSDGTPLHYAAMEGHVEVAKALLDRGADPNARDFLGFTPLHYASVYGHVEVVKLLLERGADPNLRTVSGETPLHMAVEHCAVLRLLLQHDADPNARDKHGKTPLHYAAISGARCSVELLLRHGADPNAKDADGNTPLHKAGNEKTALILAEHTEVAKNNEGQTPLHLAAERGYTRVIELLLSRGADVNDADSKGNTPLHYAAERCKAETAKLLLKHGADPTARNAEGKTPVDVAREQYEKYRRYCNSPYNCWTYRREIENCAATFKVLTAAKQP